MKRRLMLLLCTAALFGLCLFAAPSGSALAAPAAKASAYGSWREAYAAMLTDESARAAVIGKDADYRRSYFSGDPSRLAPSAYSVADLNADGTPELLLYAEGTGLTDVFSFDGALRYLGYDAFFGFLPEEGLAIVHGHWHGAGGSGDREWSAVPIFREDDWGRVYLDCMEDGGKLRYSFQEYGAFESTDWAKPGENPEAEARYEKLFDRCVRPCVRLEDIPFFSMDTLSGFVSPCELKYMRRLYNAVGTFPYAGEEFLRQNAGVELHVSRRRHVGCEFIDIHLSAHLLECAVTFELFGDSDEVDGLLFDTQCLYGGEHFLVAWLIERLRSEDLAHHGKGILIDHECAKHSALGLHRLWRHVGQSHVEGCCCAGLAP